MEAAHWEADMFKSVQWESSVHFTHVLRELSKRDSLVPIHVPSSISSDKGEVEKRERRKGGEA